MKWNHYKHEILICEILTQKSWEFRSKSPERGQIWDNIAKVHYLLDCIMVNQRSILRRYKTLETKHTMQLMRLKRLKRWKIEKIEEDKEREKHLH